MTIPTVKDKSWVATNHCDEDLREVDLRGKILYGADLRGARLYGIGIDINCDTFTGVKLDDLQVATLLRIIALADISPLWQEGLLALVMSVIGQARSKSLTRYLDIHA